MARVAKLIVALTSSVLFSCGGPKLRPVGGVMMAAPPIDHDALCRGEQRCVELCEKAEADSGLQAACSEARQAANPEARPSNAKSRSAGARNDVSAPQPTTAGDADMLADAHAIWGPGSVRHSHALPPAGIFARSASAVVVVHTPSGQGSGFVVHGSGVIVTNLHVVRGESAIKVVLWNGAELSVRRIEGYSERHDLAVLRVKNQLNTLALAAKEELLPGEHVVAIGNPLGLQLTISEGIVAGLRRKTDGTHVVQITTPISPGSSGGPILNAWGEVVGVATFKFLEGESLNFAMPIRYVHQLLARPKPMKLADFAAATARSEAEKPEASFETEGPSVSPAVGTAG
jgi:S1-C subfamily serine protease